MHKMANNYITMLKNARTLFLAFDQEEMIRRWNIPADENYLYVTFMSEPYRIERSSGILYGPDPDADQVNPSMILFDLLTYAKERPRCAGKFVSISELGGVIGSGHDRTLNPTQDELYFTGKTAQLRQALKKLQGKEFPVGDASAVVPVFEDFSILFQFWDADEEFPCVIKYLFDENALRFMHYETLWYVMGELVSRLRQIV